LHDHFFAFFTYCIKISISQNRGSGVANSSLPPPRFFAFRAFQALDARIGLRDFGGQLPRYTSPGGSFRTALRRFAPRRISLSRPFFCFFSEKSKKMVNEACQGFASWREAPLHAFGRLTRRRRARPKALHSAQALLHLPHSLLRLDR